MRYLYSVLRFVPDSARGEFVNLGVVVVSDESGEWGLRHAENFRRANSLDRDAALGAAAWLAELAGDVNDSQLDLFDPTGAHSEAWLHQQHRNQRNLVQFSEPRPTIGSSAEQVLDQLFELFVVDPERRTRQTRQEAISVLREAYVHHAGLLPRLTLHERVQVRAGSQSADFDFAVANGALAQLARTWTLAGRQPRSVVDDIRAWGYTVHRLRDRGARMLSRDRNVQFDVPTDVPIRVLYVPPATDAASEALDTARDVWLDLGVDAYPRGQEDAIAAEVAGI